MFEPVLPQCRLDGFERRIEQDRHPLLKPVFPQYRLNGVPLPVRRAPSRRSAGSTALAGLAQLMGRFVTLSIVQQVLEVDHRRGKPR